MLFLDRPFWDSRLDSLDCLCCASILLHTVATEFFNNPSFAYINGKAEEEFVSVYTHQLEVVLICFNALTLVAIFTLFVNSLLEVRRWLALVVAVMVCL